MAPPEDDLLLGGLSVAACSPRCAAAIIGTTTWSG